MPRRRSFRSATAAITLVLLAACSGGNPAASPTATTSTSSPGASLATLASPTSSPGATPPLTQASPSPSSARAQAEVFLRGTFTRPTTIDNRWFPLSPGTQWTWEGAINVDGERLGHRVISTVTDLTKVIDGVRTVVVYEQDFTPPSVRAEAELSFFAQDDEGNVWLVGEYPEEYEDGQLADAPTWLSGIEGSVAGLAMRADPQLAAPSYSEGWAPSVGFTDRARVFETGSKTCVRPGCFNDVLVIDEFNPDEPDAHQLKYYARGVGVVRVGWAGALEDTQETLQLSKMTTLSGEALASVRAAALKLEQHAYQVSEDVYGLTPPAERAQ